tara:strand:- start:426 stop:647 length:222 start_codon:yes stop_codon:yes gene_type:complete
MTITILGWVWIGILIGGSTATVLFMLYMDKKIGELQDQIKTLRGTRNVLKDELIKLNNSPKPKPRTRRKGYKK